jgi:hypothetical protein
MRCTSCHRPLLKATVTVQSKNGPMHLGPDCARKAGLTVGKIKTIVKLSKLSKSNKLAKISINQLDLFNGEAEDL